VGITGTDLIQPPDEKAPKLFKSATITIGRPIKPERYVSAGTPEAEQHRAWREMIDEVMFEIREMTGQVYKNVYAGKSTESTVVDSVATGQVGHVSDRDNSPVTTDA
jgi:1-acyl-sn-glycerol-3-phosphate acyltransferase